MVIAFGNTDLLNLAFSKLKFGDTLLIPNTTFYLNGGVVANNLTNVTI